MEENAERAEAEQEKREREKARLAKALQKCSLERRKKRGGI